MEMSNLVDSLAHVTAILKDGSLSLILPMVFRGIT